MALLTRARIIDGARCLVERNGHEQLSLRSLAAELDVTAPALYDHVASKDEVLELVAAEGFDELSTRYDVVAEERPIDRVRARALAYVGFARDRPQLFRLMFMYRPRAVTLAADNELQAATTVFDAAVRDVHRAIADGDLVDRDADRLGLLLWASMHGVATLATYAAPVADTLAAEVIDTLLVGLRPSSDDARDRHGDD
jgi:AcrR family transcriptional regulator